jgi:type II secretory pathway pseudopilin PulG
MTKRNNKGFSLVDSIIAVAVLSLLITPILYQVIHTLNTSRQAKERQYVLDNAQYVMTYFQSTKDEGLFKTDEADPTLNIVEDDLSSSDSKVDVLAAATTDVYCDLYLCTTDISTGDHTVDSNRVADCDIDIADAEYGNHTIKYGVDCYQLSTVPLGKNGNSYERTVVVDDLASKLINIKDAEGSIKYDIMYGCDTSFSESEISALESAGWTLTNEGSFVKYQDITLNGKTYSVINAAIVSERDKFYTETGDVINTRYSDPNSMEMSFMQNLDANKVALIQGNAASFDRQAEKDFFNIKMSYLKVENPEQYNQILTTKTGETGFNGTDTAKKVSRISIKKTTDATGKECYQVDCDVFYIDTFQLVSGMATHTETLNYNVYSKKFYTTNKSPDIYFVYEPFVTNSSDFSSDFRYADTDTIVVYNDVESRNSKLYLIKPEWDQLSVKYDRNDLANNAEDADGHPLYDENHKYMDPDDDIFFTKNYRGRLVPVKIQIGWIGSTYVSGEAKNAPLHVFTNIRTEKKYPNATRRDAELTTSQRYDRIGNLKPYTSTIVEELAMVSAPIFVSDGHEVVTAVKDYTYPDYSDGVDIDADPSNDLGNTKKDYIRSIVDDVTSSDRLNTVTVTFRKVGSSDTETPIARYSGAKEVN